MTDRQDYIVGYKVGKNLNKHCDPNTGVFTNKVTRGRNAMAETAAGGVNAKGYINICVDQRNSFMKIVMVMR